MNFQEALDYLYAALPMYQRVGQSAFKKDLTNTLALCAALDNPHQKFKSIHVAGTNGKGSSSHMLASVFQQAGYKTGLYTSPHLKSFTERIRINGQPISEQAVIDFVQNHKHTIEQIQPSFFEMTVALAFHHFAQQTVDIAIIEVGLGGRLDSTNVITPELSLITNIGMDHMEFLGDTLELIAGEKAGIIKTGVPVVVGTTQPETAPVFLRVAQENQTLVTFADQVVTDLDYKLDLEGAYQQQNLPGVLQSIVEMRSQGWAIGEAAVRSGLAQVVSNTGLKGRWQKLSNNPLTICDTGHNVAGVEAIIDQIISMSYKQLHLVLGFVNDKNVAEVLTLFPSGALFYFCQSTVPRAMPLDQVKSIAESLSIRASYIANVNEALSEARTQADAEDFIFVGGSTFVVAELNDL